MHSKTETLYGFDTVPKRIHTKKNPIIIEDWKVRIFAVVLFLVLFLLMINVNFNAEKTIDYYVGAFATVSFAYMLLKVLLSFFYKPVRKKLATDYKVSVIIPNYNENIASVKGVVECLFAQDYPIYEIIFIDDGSEDDTAYQYVSNLSKSLEEDFSEASVSHEDRNLGNSSDFARTKLVVHRFNKNKGKREAMAWGFRRAEGDVLMLVDSDGYIYPDATRELLRPLNDEKVTSVVGHINARNVRDNLITRLQDILYHNAFRINRAAQSITNCVLVCSGALSVHRTEMIKENLDEFLKKKSMGICVENGDDRCLTNLSLKGGGKTKYQSTAMCITDVPIKTGNFFRQQVRWAKSFYLYTFESMKHAWNKPFMMMWLMCEGFLWVFFVISQIVSLFSWSQNFSLTVLIFSVGYFIYSTMITGIYYVFKNPFLYAFTPFFTLIHMLLLFPIRMYALITINKTGWGTR